MSEGVAQADDGSAALIGEGPRAELRREQEHLDRVMRRLDDLRAEAAATERDSLRAPHGGTPQAVYERDVTVVNAAARRADLDLAGEGLLFGRLDREDAGVLHVGRLGVRTADQEPLIIDWRAPAAAAYYQATAAEPLGVVRRRTITTARGAVRALEDELLQPDAVDQLEGTVVVGDGAFMAAVSRERGEHMRDIVATIAAEQDRAVRARDSGALVVTGGPGTGKTAVALHRVAYLLYERRDYYARRSVLVVGPSAVFVDYISQVLPALGETSVRLASVGSLPALPGLRVGGYDPPAVAAVKGSARMADVVASVVRALSRPASDRVALRLTRYGIELTVRPAELLSRRDRLARSARTHNAGRTTLADAVVDVVWKAWNRRAGATRIEADDRTEFGDWVRDEPAFLRCVDALWPLLDPTAVFAGMRSGAVDWRSAARRVLDPAEIALLEQSWSAAGDPRELTAGDAAIVDELRALLGPPPPAPVDADEEEDYFVEIERTHAVTTQLDRDRHGGGAEEPEEEQYAHVVVDEAQDVTPMQWRMLGRRAGGATWTIVGDWAQSAWPVLAEVRAAMSTCLGRARVTEATLSTNYRTSTEIAALAARVLEQIDPAAVAPAAVRATGHDPVLRGATGEGWAMALREEVEAVLAQVGGTVAVICAHAREQHVTEAVRQLLDEHARLRVLDAWAIKGLEFDGCVVTDPDLLVREGITATAGLRSLYVALTRATQRLTVLAADPLPPVLGAP